MLVRGGWGSAGTQSVCFLTQTRFIFPSLLSFSLSTLDVNELSILSVLSLLCSLSQNKVGFLHGDRSCFTVSKHTDPGFVLDPVISGCVIRNSTELPIWRRKKKDDPR
ncbi:hypothetical protein NQZ68_029788 [Dissostichus eleginoides]|nr:hypothetical protein NQZ68_029788 [Dissostichus eleginoides]